jgi:hypothetical protein
MPTKKPAAKKSAKRVPAKHDPNNITYTIRTIPRAVWFRFAQRLHNEGGRSINWALNHFVERVAEGTYKFE